MDLLPDNYLNSSEVVDLQNAVGEVANNLIIAKDDLFSQLFVNDATWGLAKWEKALGLPTDISKTYAFRRERIQSKLRGSGTTTKEMIKQAAIAYSNGEVEVIEDPANYSFKIKFVGTRGIPGNMADLKLTIEEIKPAHLNVIYEFTYNTWSEVSTNKWGDVSGLTWYQLATK
jgi:uncharacterized protein YmfQ (DUF2313 family)